MKKYSVNNVSTPARPVGLMVKKTEAADGTGFKNVMPKIPTILTEEEYEACKKAIDNYVKAGLLTLKVLNAEKPKVEEKSDSDKAKKDAIVKEAKEKFGVDLFVGRKATKTLEAELYALEADAAAEEVAD